MESPPNWEGVVQVVCASVTHTGQVLHLHTRSRFRKPVRSTVNNRVAREQMQQVQGSAWSLLVVGECARDMLRPRVRLFCVQQSRTQVNTYALTIKLLQFIDQLLDLGLGAKSWPAACLHPVHRVGDCALRQGGNEADAAVPHAAVLALGLLRIVLLSLSA
jgi:hypothetical protein